MEQILINLIAGVVGGIGLGKLLPTFNFGVIGNSTLGLLGGGFLGWIVILLLPTTMAAAQGHLSIGGIILQAIVGGAGGAIITVMIAVGGPRFHADLPIDPVGPSH